MDKRKTGNSLRAKLLMAFLSIALVFTMMPLSIGSVYADADPVVFTIEDTDGTITEFKLSEMKAMTDVNDITIDYNGVKINKGISVSKLLEPYASKETAVVTVTTADAATFSGTVNASGKTVKYLRENGYILAYQINGNSEFDPVTNSGDTGYFHLYGKDSNGSYKRDKWVDKFKLTESSGETPVDPPVVDIADLTITGNIVKAETEFSIKDLKKNIDIQRYTEMDYPSLNKSGTFETSKVSGVRLEDLIKYVGLKEGATITKVSAVPYNSDGTENTKKIQEYTKDDIEKTDIRGNKAMFIWAELEQEAQENGVTEYAKVQRTIIGQFSDTDPNRSRWGRDIKKIIVEGTITEPEPAPAVKDGDTAVVNDSTYTVTSAAAGTAAIAKAKNTKKVTVPDTVAVNGVTLKVTKVNANAFTGKKIRTVTLGANIDTIEKYAFKKSKAKTLVVKTKALTKASVKGSLKGSKVKTVKVKVGSKKENKKYVKKYKKFFTKKNAGKKAKVRR